MLPILAAFTLVQPLTATAVDAPLPNSIIQSMTSGGRVYTPADFSRFTPRDAMDMLERVPGFVVTNNTQGRGLGQAGTNVLINGKRISSKSQDVFDQLRRVTADQVDRIEIVDGATLDLPGLSGQVANIITRYGDISGRYEYRTQHRPRYAEPSWFGGEISASGSTASTEWNAAFSQGSGRGAAAGKGFITDLNDVITQWRDIYWHVESQQPLLSGSLKWTGPNGMVANINAQYSQTISDVSNDEARDLVSGIDRIRDFDNHGRDEGVEIGGDIEFPLGPGMIKLIGLDRLNQNSFGQDSTLIYADDSSPSYAEGSSPSHAEGSSPSHAEGSSPSHAEGSPTTGNRFLGHSKTGERIARAEYRWDMLGGNWEVDAEAAFNRFDQASEFFNLEPGGGYVEIPLPNGSGEVTEERYEAILTHGRTLGEGVTMQLGIGGEHSTLAQSGPRGLTREFWRPKGSLSLAWTPRIGLDLSLNIARRVGQLSFGDFLASVSLERDNATAGNVELKPTLRWESNLQIKQNLGGWGSTTLQFYTNQYDDYIDIIPIPGGGESPGNIDSAVLYGARGDTTINLDPLGWDGVRIDVGFSTERSRVDDPLTGVERSFSNFYESDADISLRHDVPGTDWAWGLGWQYHSQVNPRYRLSQVETKYTGPTFTRAFIEYKDFFGLTANLNVFNLTDGREIYHRTVYDGLRDSAPVLFNEYYNLSMTPTFRLQLTGNF